MPYSFELRAIKKISWDSKNVLTITFADSEELILSLDQVEEIVSSLASFTRAEETAFDFREWLKGV